MTETFAALLLAHTLADFVLQSAAMAEAKARRDVGAFAAHIAIVAGCSAAALGAASAAAWMLVAAVAAVHLAIDLAKTFAPQGLAAFLADQTAHLASLAIAAAIWPAAMASGPWSGFAALPALMAMAAGGILAVRAGGFAVALLMRPWGEMNLEGLQGAGRVIGQLERGLIFLLILVGEPAAVGYLVAAKSVLRFGAVKDDAKKSEYVIVGTLASFGWAILVAAGTVWMLASLPPLGIPDLSP
jgi:Protein of unknown function (DUF3307)